MKIYVTSHRIQSRSRLGTYRTSAVTHPDVTFNVKRRRSRESERFHVGKHLGFEYLALAP